MKKFWRVWAKALGDKSGKSNKEADTIALKMYDPVSMYRSSPSMSSASWV